jgi:5-bromo-4-chloroindolyl phosphate hydrolysis protein
MDLFKQNIENRVTKLEHEFTSMKQEQLLQKKDVEYLKQDLNEIKENTKWLRRAVTNAFIVAAVGGAVAIFYGAFQLMGGN